MTNRQLALALEMFANSAGNSYSWDCIAAATGREATDYERWMFWSNILYRPEETIEDVFMLALEAAARLRGH